jgi:hypothetical protein
MLTVVAPVVVHVKTDDCPAPIENGDAVREAVSVSTLVEFGFEEGHPPHPAIVSRAKQHKRNQILIRCESPWARKFIPCEIREFSSLA